MIRNLRIPTGVAFSVWEQLLRLGIQLINVSLLARLIPVSSWGYAAIFLILVSLVLALLQLAIEPFVVSRRRIKKSELVAAYSLAIKLSFVYLIASFSLALIFRDYAAPLVASGISAISWAYGSIQRALLVRWKRFRRLFAIGVFSSLVNLVFSISLALLDFFSLAVVLGSAAAQLAASIASKPTMHVPFEWKSNIFANELLMHLRHGALRTVFGFITRSLDTILVVIFLGLMSAGIYDRLYQFILVATQLLSLIMNRVVIITLKGILNEDNQLSSLSTKLRIKEVNLQIFAFSSFLHLPLILSPVLVLSLVYGANYAQYGSLLTLLGCAGYLQSVTASTSPLFLAAQRLRTQTNLMTITTTVYVMAYAAALFLGFSLEGLIRSYVWASIFTTAITIFAIKKVWREIASTYVIPFLVAILVCVVGVARNL